MNRFRFYLYFAVVSFVVACGDSGSDNAANVADNRSCVTEELNDKSGLKVICDGDSIGVVLYGKDGKDGVDGKSCTTKQVKDGIQVTCGDNDPVTILNGKDGKNGTDGKDGKDGADGKSAYELSGFDGTLAEWLESLKGADGKSCKTKEVKDGIQVTCGDEDPVTIKNGKDGDGCTVRNTDVAMKIICGKDSVVVSLTGADGKTRYICADPDCSSWRVATDIEKDTMGWGHDFKDGAVRNGRVNTDFTYVYEKKNWRLGTNLDSLLVKAGGSACMNVGDTSKVKYDNVYYVCTADVGDAIRGWVKAPDLYNDTYEARGECKASGKYENGTILAGRVNADKKYVCDGGMFRLADKMEVSGNLGCTSFNRDTLLILANQYSYYKCTKNGWSFTLEKLNTGTLEDSRDGQVYKTVGVKGQMWMAENLKIDYKLPQKNDAEVYGNVCYEDDCDIYGRYYTWSMAMDSAGLYSTNGKGCGYGTTCTPTYPVRGISPKGWHLPSVSEWETLYISMNGSPNDMQAKGFEQWAQATDAYKFSALPAGSYGHDVGFVHVGKNAVFWTSDFEKTTLADSTTAHYWDLYINRGSIVHGNVVYGGFTVRCVKDSETK